MPQLSTLSYVADIVVRRTLADAASDPTLDLPAAIEAAYPFDQCPVARRIWVDTVSRHSFKALPLMRFTQESVRCS